MSRTGQITITSVANIAKYFFKNSTGSYVASGIQGTELNPNDTSTYGFNSLLAPAAFKIQYNNIPFIELTSVTNSTTNTQDNTLRFYSSSTTTRGPRAMELTNSELAFYNIDSSNDKVASLNTNGLILTSGGIIAGTAGQNGYVYLSSEDNTNSIAINGHTPTQNDPKWRQVIGTKFGVDSEGNLYANNANLKGAITATSLTIGSGSSAYNGVDAINISGYSITIEIDTTHAGLTTNQVYLKPHLLHNGEDITSTVTDKTQFIWYVNGGSIGTQGASTDGGVVAAYDDVWKVTYEFAEGAVGGASVVQTIEVDPSKYITRINQYGITVHPETISAGANYVQIDGNGFYIKTPSSTSIDISNDKILANFTANGINFYDGLGNTDTNKLASFTDSGSIIGKTLDSHVYTDYHSFQMKDKNNNTYVYFSDLRGSDGYVMITESAVGDGVSITFKTNSIFYITENATHPVVVTVNNIELTEGTDYTRSNNTFTFTTAPANGVDIVFEYYTDSIYTKAFTVGIRDTNSDVGPMSYAEGYDVKSTEFTTHAEGYITVASGRFGSHAEGNRTEATGMSAHAEGSSTHASGADAHAEGTSTYASGPYSHSEGNRSVASGNTSHAEGYVTTASGWYSHASGNGTIAQKLSQTVIGEYNVADTQGSGIGHHGKYVFIIGNGASDNARSNALTVDWDGGLSHGIQNVTSDITLTKSTGTASADTISWTAYKAGQTIFLTVSYVSSASFSNGANRDFIFTGKYAPIVGSNGFGYYQGNSVGGRIFESNENTLLRLRNTGSAFIPNGISVTFTYITEDMN